MIDDTYFSVLNELLEEYNIKKIDVNEVKNKKPYGKGSQSKVYVGEYKGMQVAVKELKEIDIKCVIHETAILSKLESEHLPEFIGVILEKKDKVSYVQRFIVGKSLDDFDIKDLSEEKRVHITKQLSKVVSYIHENNCVHRDLKAENVMIDSNFKLYLIDFGISKVLNGDALIETRAKGTMNYLAPEILEASGVDKEGQIISIVTQGSDVWAFACLVSYIFSGVVPWMNKCKQTDMIQIQLTRKTKFPIPSNITRADVIEIIKAGTIIDLKTRKTMKEIDNNVQKL